MERKVIKRKGITIIDSVGKGVDVEKVIPEHSIDLISKYINDKYSADIKR